MVFHREAATDRIITVSIKANRRWAIRPPGEGDFDVYALVKELKRSGYPGPFGLICWGLEEPPLERLNKSIRTWRKYAERMDKE